MVEEFQRPNVAPERYRELEIISMQFVMQLPHQNLGECLIVSDICTNILRRWIEDERMAHHEIAARNGTPLLATADGKIVQLKPAD